MYSIRIWPLHIFVDKGMLFRPPEVPDAKTALKRSKTFLTLHVFVFEYIDSGRSRTLASLGNIDETEDFLHIYFPLSYMFILHNQTSRYSLALQV